MTELLERDVVSPPTQVTRQERSRRTAELFREAALPCTDQRRRALGEEIVLLNIGVAHAVAHRYGHRGVDTGDLEQVACEALIKAVGRFDHSREKDFLSYAVPTIRGELQRHFRDLGWMVRPTRRVQETQWQAVRVEESLTSTLGRPPSSREVREALGITPQEFAEAQSAQGCFVPTSLDQPLSSGIEGADLGSMLPSTDRDLVTSEARVLLVPLMKKLSGRERLVLFLRYFEDLTQAEIGVKIGVGQAQVSRILNSALQGLRMELGDLEAA